MHIEYKVRLPDHNFVVGPRHTLIPSVYGVWKIKENNELSYSRNTFIRIRSGKLDSSSTHAHAYDMKEPFHSSNLPERPILVLSTDGWQDEAPRYPKPLATAIYLFKHLKLDVFLHGVNAAELSAFKPVERRMSLLSHNIAGFVLPHENFVSPLDSLRDVELEKKKFFHASQVLPDIWSHTVIDGYKVDCRALPVGKKFPPPEMSPSWAARHVQQSRYALQIVNGQDRNCCQPFMTNWILFFPERFVPFPACHKNENSGLETLEPKDYFQNQKSYKFALLHQSLLAKVKSQVSINYAIVPLDMYCPLLDGKLEKGIYKKCGAYWPSQAAMIRHRKCQRKTTAVVESNSDSSVAGLDSDENDVSEISISDNNCDTEENIEVQFAMPILNIISDVIQSPFTDLY